MTKPLVHEERFDVAAERLFALLVTPSAIRDWWGAARAVVVPDQDGTWAAAWGADEDAPDYVTAARIAVHDPPRRLVLDRYRYRTADGSALPFEGDVVTAFEVEPDGDGARLRVVQEGFPAGPEADPFRAECARGWADTFAGIRRHLAR